MLFFNNMFPYLGATRINLFKLDESEQTCGCKQAYKEGELLIEGNPKIYHPLKSDPPTCTRICSNPFPMLPFLVVHAFVWGSLSESRQVQSV